MSQWVKICSADDFRGQAMRSFDPANGRMILVVNIGGTFYAADGICTHQNAELAEGFLNSEDKTVTCPLHLSVFSLVDGTPQNPPAELPLKVYQTKAENGYVYALL